ncbi:EF-hand domain-containing protein [Nitratidesulfovibrio sp. SRB-5]|uniref:EF-hand domain-containing protein n=1 Tax=Nitratidesulfovibrio sp. SRB-5 TaxID=2872636 RepID=UPI001025D2BF|nr:EF-hand domain-containing protein [Nitratidesulfovibrio sp. SRB-5]MBZ2172218.1 EF-hand domain-containing protein [Nitratidesulfovibrio sp. SRB-5]RXF76097.1 EF-hand domain-containing protein [Desulfovibrio sp. DS-1]
MTDKTIWHDHGARAESPDVARPGEPAMKESRIPLITALFCGLLLHTEFTAMAEHGVATPGDAAPAVEAPPSTTPGSAATRKEQGHRFDLADRDHDGSLSREEAAHPETGLPVVTREFANIDTNGDGKLSKAELLRFARERRQANHANQTNHANQARRVDPKS